MLAIAAITAIFALFHRWHEVSSPDPVGIAGAFYIGPDYHVTPEERARMLSRKRHWECTGMTHLSAGPWPIAAFAAVAVVALAAALWPSGRSTPLIPAIAAFVAAAVVGFYVFSWGLLRHVFDSVGSPYPAARVFSGAQITLALSALVLLVAAGVEDRQRRRTAHVLSEDQDRSR